VGGGVAVRHLLANDAEAAHLDVVERASELAGHQVAVPAERLHARRERLVALVLRARLERGEGLARLRRKPLVLGGEQRAVGHRPVNVAGRFWVNASYASRKSLVCMQTACARASLSSAP